MKTFVIGSVAGALVGALAVYFFLNPDARGNPRSAVVTVSGDSGTQCKAKVDPFRIGNKRNLKVHWIVDADAAPCASGDWRIELRFDNAADGTVWNGGTVTLARNGSTPYKISETANYGKFPYHVWYISGGTSYEMADPEIQVEM